MKWLICDLHGHYRDCQVELQIMPKLYLGPGLSQRVHQALSRRLEQFMAANVAGSVTPAAPSTESAEFPVSENPALSAPALPAQTGVTETDSEKEKDQDTVYVDGEEKEEKEEGDTGRDDDRSRSPRLRRHHESFDPNEAADLLSSTTGLAVGITSMVAALKGSTDKLEILIKSTHTLQSDLCRSLEAVGEAVTNMARASESLAAGANHNTSRVGAMVGELTKLKKHVEWSLDASMKDTLRDNKKGRLERDQSLQDIMSQLQESMDKLQENLKLVAERIERATPPAEIRGTPPAEIPPAYDPPLAPMDPPLAPMTPAMAPAGPGTSVPPPPAIPPRPAIPAPPTLQTVRFAGYSPARMGEVPMSYPLGLEVKDMKSPPTQVIEEVTGRVRAVSPTPRHDPLTGTAAFSPLGYMQIQGTREYRRVYP